MFLYGPAVFNANNWKKSSIQYPETKTYNMCMQLLPRVYCWSTYLNIIIIHNYKWVTLMERLCSISSIWWDNLHLISVIVTSFYLCSLPSIEIHWPHGSKYIEWMHIWKHYKTNVYQTKRADDTWYNHLPSFKLFILELIFCNILIRFTLKGCTGSDFFLFCHAWCCCLL